jgi:hypothetical protein
MSSANKNLKLEGKEAFYCRQVCKARCCTFISPEEGIVPCPNLTSKNECGVYQERYADGMPDLVQVGTYKSRTIKNLQGEPADRSFFCGRIVNIIAANGLAPSVEAQCCIAHPELLERIEEYGYKG